MKKYFWADIGNSRIKICLMDSDDELTVDRINPNEISAYNWNNLKNGFCYITSVNKSNLAYFLTYTKIYNISTHIAEREVLSKILSYKIDMSKFASIGIDRLVATHAAVENFGFNTLSVDCGTALTTNYVDKDGEFRGGVISPGFEMRLEALNEKTGDLPKANLDLKPVNILNSNTEKAIAAGVFWGVWAEVEFMISKIGAKNVVITGGGAKYLFDLITNLNIYYDENLIFKGALSLAKKEKFFV